jgi:hypothetical protein
VIGATVTVTVAGGYRRLSEQYPSVSAVTDGSGSYSVDFEATLTVPEVI